LTYSLTHPSVFTHTKQTSFFGSSIQLTYLSWKWSVWPFWSCSNSQSTCSHISRFFTIGTNRSHYLTFPFCADLAQPVQIWFHFPLWGW